MLGFNSEIRKKEYLVSERYKITSKFNTSCCMRSVSSHSD